MMGRRRAFLTRLSSWLAISAYDMAYSQRLLCAPMPPVAWIHAKPDAVPMLCLCCAYAMLCLCYALAWIDSNPMKLHATCMSVDLLERT